VPGSTPVWGLFHSVRAPVENAKDDGSCHTKNHQASHKTPTTHTDDPSVTHPNLHLLVDNHSNRSTRGTRTVPRVKAGLVINFFAARGHIVLVPTRFETHWALHFEETSGSSSGLSVMVPTRESIATLETHRDPWTSVDPGHIFLWAL